MRQWATRVVLFSILTFVLTFGASFLRSRGIFEEDRHETKHQIELIPIKALSSADLRNRLPDYMPWADGSSVARAYLQLALGETAVHGYYQTGPPPSRAPPSRLV
jgi:hypothetical protein